jgi:peptidyl-prolyl cis-trans isomerase D
MLDVMRKHARNWIMKLILGIIIVVFIFYFGSMSGRNRADRIAMIDGKPIVHVEFQKEYETLLDMYREKMGRALTEEMLKALDLKRQAFDNLINQVVLLEKAKDLEIRVSDDDVKKAILSYPAFQRGGVFDDRVYQQVLRASKMTPEQFEDSQRKLFLSAQVEDLIQGGIVASDEEALDFYRMQKEKLNLAFVQVFRANFAEALNPSQAELETYLKANEAKFRVPEQIQVKYLTFMVQDYAGTVVPSEAEIADYYDKHSEIYKKKDKTTSLADAREAIIGEIKQGAGKVKAFEAAKKAHDEIYQQENFDAYAAQKKLAVKTTDFSRINTPPEEFKSIDQWGKAVSRLQDGEISRVIQGDKGYYIVKIAARKAPYVPALKEIASEVEKEFRQKEGDKLAKKKAEELFAGMKKGETMEALAKKSGLKVDETGFFQPGGAIPKLGSSTELNEALFQLSPQKPYPDRFFTVGDGYAIVALRERSKADEGDFVSRKDAIVQYLSRAEKTEVFKKWLEASRDALVKQGRLKIERDVKDL